MLRKDIIRTLDGDRRTVDPQELLKFDALADEWWKSDGKFKVVHAFNAARVQHIIDLLAERRRSASHTTANGPLHGLRVLDAGCGAGIVSLPLAAAGADVTGIDASARSVAIAERQADKVNSKAAFSCTTPNELVAGSDKFDAVVCLEVVEHVADLSQFLRDLSELVTDGGLLILGTLNRTVSSYVLAIIGAEYVMGLLPRGTHDWRRFVRPSELTARLSSGGFAEIDRRGVSFNPLNGAWSLTSNTSVNYLITFEK